MNRKSFLLSALVVALSVSALTISLISASAVGQRNVSRVPSQIAYQAYLQEKDGAPVDERSRVQFNLYEARDARAPVWQETHDVIPEAGFISVMLGSDQPLKEDLFSSGSLFLGVSVDGEPESSPRQQLASVPFAIMASNASVANDLDCAGCINSRHIADGSISVSGALESADGQYRVEVTNSGIVFHGPGGQIEFAAGSEWTVTSDDHLAIVSERDLRVESDGELDIVSTQDLTLSGGSNVLLESAANADFRAGSNLTAEAAASTRLDGSTIQLGGNCSGVARIGDPIISPDPASPGGSITNGSSQVFAC